MVLPFTLRSQNPTLPQASLTLRAVRVCLQQLCLWLMTDIHLETGSMTHEIPALGTCCLFSVAHKQKAHKEFITFQFPWLKWVLDYLKEAVNVYRDLRKSHFSFHLADGRSGFVSLVIFCCICQYFFLMLTYMCKCYRSCIVYQNISDVLVWSCHLILKEGWNYLNGAELWCHKLCTA